MICKQFVLAIIRHDSDCCTKGHESGRKYRTSHTSKHVIRTHFGGAAITCPSRIPSDLHFSTSFPSVIARLITHCLPIVSCFQSHIWGWKMENHRKSPNIPSCQGTQWVPWGLVPSYVSTPRRGAGRSWRVFKMLPTWKLGSCKQNHLRFKI